MDMPIKTVSSSEFRKTPQGNLKICKKFYATGQHQIILTSMNVVEDAVILRGDLGKINVEAMTILDVGCVIRPCLNSVSPPFEYKGIKIGKCCYIGKHSIISATNIGDYSYIGDNCILVKFFVVFISNFI